MRPVRRGTSPRADDFPDYREARPDLISRLGNYCSYCERRINHALAVEHIKPKAKSPELEGKWENFLLGCTSCNSTKLTKNVVPGEVLLPDRDNTFAAFDYLPDGRIVPAPGLEPGIGKMAVETLETVGLDKRIGRAVDLERGAQRMEAWSKAVEARTNIEDQPNNEALKRLAVNWARAEGHFSIWMTVFVGYPEMQTRLVDAFDGTRESGCFGPSGCDIVSPAPNPDWLPDGGKV